MINYVLLIICIINIILSLIVVRKVVRKNSPEDLLLCINAYLSYLNNSGTLTLLDVVKLCNDHNVDYNTCEAIALSLSAPPQNEEETYLS